jgi:hypothetical protein
MVVGSKEIEQLHEQQQQQQLHHHQHHPQHHPSLSSHQQQQQQQQQHPPTSHAHHLQQQQQQQQQHQLEQAHHHHQQQQPQQHHHPHQQQAHQQHQQQQQQPPMEECGSPTSQYPGYHNGGGGGGGGPLSVNVGMDPYGQPSPYDPSRGLLDCKASLNPDCAGSNPMNAAFYYGHPQQQPGAMGELGVGMPNGFASCMNPMAGGPNMPVYPWMRPANGGKDLSQITLHVFFFLRGLSL